MTCVSLKTDVVARSGRGVTSATPDRLILRIEPATNHPEREVRMRFFTCITAAELHDCRASAKTP